MNKPLYFAPMEGINNYIYRNAFRRHYKGVDRFYTPFIDINSDGGMKQKSRKDILPENNEGICLVPQVLTRNAQALGKVTGEVRALGYEEVNLNLGCPSPTVTKKGKGSAMLEDPEILHRFLEEALALSKTRLSVKIRIGMTDPEEWQGIMDCLNDFPLAEVIIHPRLMTEGYSGQIHEDIFRQMLEASKNPVCVNPGIHSPEEYAYWETTCPYVTGIMIGRALVATPSLAEQIDTLRKQETSGQNVTSSLLCNAEETVHDIDRFFTFHDDLLASYVRVLSGETPVLFKMKELWTFWGKTLSIDEKTKKKLAKAQRLSEYESLALQIRNSLVKEENYECR